MPINAIHKMPPEPYWQGRRGMKHGRNLINTDGGL